MRGAVAEHNTMAYLQDEGMQFDQEAEISEVCSLSRHQLQCTLALTACALAAALHKFARL